MSTPYPVAIVGVGNMGGAMAERLLASGWPVLVCDCQPERGQALAARGATPHALAADAARAASLIIVCVVDAEQSRDVLFGAGAVADAMHLGHTVMLCPTMAPADVESIALQLRPFGLHLIDAPMSGGPARAREGSMSLMVACPQTVFERHRILIEILSNKVFRISEKPGDGARTKLVNNLAAGINLVGAAEVLALAQRLGLDMATTLDVIEQSSGQSWIGSDRMRRAINADFAPRAHMTLLEKDTRLALQAAQSVGFRGPLGAHARDVFAQASAGGLAQLDDAALLQWLTRPDPPG
ncbi:MAG: NAD(P)-dependent oxidoreductase [Betaproteobacteria bacterium]